MYSAICIVMKIRFLRDVLADIQKTRLNETWDHLYRRWDELLIETIFEEGKVVAFKTYEGDIISAIPVDAFTVLKEEKPTVAL